MDMTRQAWPDRYEGRQIKEVLFCRHFLAKHPVKWVLGRLCNVDGLTEE